MNDLLGSLMQGNHLGLHAVRRALDEGVGDGGFHGGPLWLRV